MRSRRLWLIWLLWDEPKQVLAFCSGNEAKIFREETKVHSLISKSSAYSSCKCAFFQFMMSKEIRIVLSFLLISGSLVSWWSPVGTAFLVTAAQLEAEIPQTRVLRNKGLKALGGIFLNSGPLQYPFYLVVPMLVYFPDFTVFQKWKNCPVSTQHNQLKLFLYRPDKNYGWVRANPDATCRYPLGTQLEYYSLQGRKGLELRQRGWVVLKFNMPRKCSSLLCSWFLRLEEPTAKPLCTW